MQDKLGGGRGEVISAKKEHALEKKSIERKGRFKTKEGPAYWYRGGACARKKNRESSMSKKGECFLLSASGGKALLDPLPWKKRGLRCERRKKRGPYMHFKGREKKQPGLHICLEGGE